MITDAMLAGMVSMRPCVPAKDYEQSLEFYQRLGFSAWSLGDRMSHMQLGTKDGLFAFLLQGQYEKDWAENFTMHLLVDDLDAWWSHIQGLALDKRFPVGAPVAPRIEPWGLKVCYVWDPSGVVWHFAQDLGQE